MSMQSLITARRKEDEISFLSNELAVKQEYLKSINNKYDNNLTTKDKLGYEIFLLKHYLDSLED